MRRLFNRQWQRDFLATESAAGIVMLLAAASAMLLANSPLSTLYRALIELPLFHGMTVSTAVKDILMAVFFFAVGMELKSEMREGALAAPGQKILPLIAALGGILAPALIYLALTTHDVSLRAGWAIPTATDIAFALCVLRIAGPHLPQTAKMFLLAIAIYDDLAAILIIAFFYSGGLSPIALAATAGITVLMWLLNRRGVTRLTPYLLLGAALWYAIHAAGIHPTVAGVITGLMIPLRGADGQGVLNPFLHRLHPYVAFAVLPLFAFTTAGLDLRTLAFADAFAPLPLGIALALLLGKPIGIVAATLCAMRLTTAKLPSSIGMRVLVGIAATAGIGFTMSLFIGQLAFTDTAARDAVKLGVMAGSLLSAGAGILILRRA